MNYPEFKTNEEWRNGIPQGPWWRDVDWPLVLTVILGAVVGCAIAGLV
jgi:hypothetical protein